MVRRFLALIALPVLAFAFAACGGGDNNNGANGSAPGSGDDSGNGNGGQISPTPAPSGERLSDSAYLEVICIGLEDFAQAVDTATTAGEIADVIEDFIASLAIVSPPEDLQVFHDEFLTYLQNSVSDPTRPLVTQPPLPPDDVRQRMSDLEPTIDACRNPTFFSQ